MRFVKKLEKVILAESVLCILTLTLIFVGWHFDAVVFFYIDYTDYDSNLYSNSYCSSIKGIR